MRHAGELRRCLDGDVVIALQPTQRAQSCALCRRDSFQYVSRHHLVPRCRGGQEKVRICNDCHRAIHATFSNKELAQKYSSVEVLLEHEGFAKMVQFIAKQDGRVLVRLNKKQRRRGRNG